MCRRICYSGAVSRLSDDELAAEWHDLMGRFHRLTCRMDRELDTAHGISVSDFEVLQQLYAAGPEHSMRMHELAENVHLTQSALSRLIARLENDGLVQRTMCTEDRRSVFTTATPAGIERYLAARPTQRAILREAADARDAREAKALLDAPASCVTEPKRAVTEPKRAVAEPKRAVAQPKRDRTRQPAGARA
jgi:DNA-binding MarR family transcriptional regulator